MTSFDQTYWNQRYQAGQTGWDLAGVSPAFQAWVRSRADFDAPTLIPGCGNAHEARYLLDNGFRNIHLLDISTNLIQSLQHDFAEPIQDGKITLHCQDFFSFQGTFEWIFEQTFFCALDPSLRPDYVQQMHDLLSASGQLIGLLFNRSFSTDGPPFGGTLSEYKALFAPYFHIHQLHPTDMSISPRLGSEVWIEFSKKS